MWPKALAQLIELAPHITRIVPLADRFFQSKSASEESTRRAMDAMAEGLRGDLGQVTASHAGLYRQLNDQSEKLAVISGDLHALKSAGDASEHRLARLEARLSTTGKLLLVALLLNVVTVVLLVVVLLRHH